MSNQFRESSFLRFCCFLCEKGNKQFGFHHSQTSSALVQMFSPGVFSRCFLQVCKDNLANALVPMFSLSVPTQTCLLTRGGECLVEPSVQLMRKCLPKTPLPLTSDQSAYTFPLPGRSHYVPEVMMDPGKVDGRMRVNSGAVVSNSD